MISNSTENKGEEEELYREKKRIDPIIGCIQTIHVRLYVKLLKKKKSARICTGFSKNNNHTWICIDEKEAIAYLNKDENERKNVYKSKGLHIVG